MSRPGGMAGFGPSRPSSSFPLWKVLVVVALVIELVVILFLVTNRSEVDVSAQDVQPQDASPQAGRFEEPGAPYSFAYPETWELETDGAVTKLLSPGNEIAIAVGPAPSGDVLSASDRLIAGLTERYDNARTDDRRLTSVGGNLGLTVSGSAVNEFGIKVRFAVVTFEGKDGNYAITSFAAGVEEGEAEQALQEVVGDFELLN